MFKRKEIIYEENDEVSEMYFITSGVVDIGFTHPSRGFISSLTFYKNSYICAFNVLSDTKSEYKYVATEKTEAFTLEKSFLIKVLD
jgi:signal-transduction protein with cAMP-binding, CBS, and nucleotidyltransferase domain